MKMQDINKLDGPRRIIADGEYLEHNKYGQWRVVCLDDGKCTSWKNKKKDALYAWDNKILKGGPDMAIVETKQVKVPDGINKCVACGADSVTESKRHDSKWRIECACGKMTRWKGRAFAAWNEWDKTNA